MTGSFRRAGFRFVTSHHTRAPLGTAPLARRAEMHSYSVRVNNVLSFAVSVWMVLCAMATASGEFRYPRANERTRSPGD